MAVGDLQYAFNPAIGETPQTIAAKRALALAIMGNTSHAPRDIGEGLNSVGQAIMYRNLMKGVNAGEGAGYNGATKVMASLFGGGDQNQFPAAPALSATSPDASALPPSVDHPVPPVNVGSADTSSQSSGDTSALMAAITDPAQRSKLPAGMRNNNPGNIKFVGQNVPGIVGPSQNTDQGDPQAVFDSPVSGMRAMYGLLGRKYAGGKTTANDIIAGQGGWTPGNFQAAANVARNAGLKPDQDINFNDPQAAARFMRGLMLQEHGEASKLYPDSLIQSAISGQPSTPPAVSAVNALAAGQAANIPNLPSQAPVPQPSPIQVASNDPSAGMGSIPPAAGPPPNAMPALPAAGPIPPDRPLPTGIDPSMLAAPMPYAPQPAPNDAKAAIAQAMSGQGGGVPASAPAPAPAAQKIAAALMQQQALTGGAPMGMQASAGAPVPPQALPPTDATPAPQQVAQAAPQGPDPSQLPAMAGGNSDVVQPGSMPRTGPTPQQLIEAAGNPWVMQRYGPIVDAMISQQMTPHKLEMVPLGNGITAEIDSLTGKQVGQIKGQPDLKSIKDAAGNEYMFNPADPTHPITVDTLLGGGGQAGGQAAPNGQADPYASPFPRTIARTDVMKDYEGYLAQSKSLNQPPMSFNDYQMNLKKEGAQSVVFNQENAANKAVGEAVGNNMADYINGTKDARSKLQALDMIKGVLDKYGDNISTGPGANTMLSIKQAMANVFPSMADAPGPTEMLQKLSTQLATADAKGLASRPTQFDFATYLKNNPGIQMSIQGQKALVDLKLQQAQHDYELGSMASHKQYSAHPDEWADVVAKYDQEHPLINPLTGKPADAGATDFPAPKDGAQAAPSAAPVTGAKQAPDGNWYVPDPNRPGKYLKVVQ